MTETKVLFTSEQHVEAEQQKQASYTLTAVVLQDELIRAAARERQLQIQLDNMKDDVCLLQTQLEQQSHLLKELHNLKLEKKLTQHDSMFDDFSVCGLIMRSSLHEAALRIASRLCVWLSVHPVPISNSRKKRLVWGKNEWKSRMMVTP